MSEVLHFWGHLPNMFKCFVQRLKKPVGAGGGGVLWVNFCWVCGAGLSEPLPHYSLFCGHVIDHILDTFGKT